MGNQTTRAWKSMQQEATRHGVHIRKRARACVLMSLDSHMTSHIWVIISFDCLPKERRARQDGLASERDQVDDASAGSRQLWGSALLMMFHSMIETSRGRGN